MTSEQAAFQNVRFGYLRYFVEFCDHYPFREAAVLLIMGIIKEFKTFAIRGNVVDLAVGVIIGAAFGKIVTSIVEDLIMPPIGYITGGIDFASKKLVLKHADKSQEIAEVSIKYGNFINTVIQFLIIAFCVFLLVKLINALRVKEEKTPQPIPPPSKEELLLAEIRDILKEKK